MQCNEQWQSNNFSCYSSVYHLIHYPKRLVLILLPYPILIYKIWNVAQNKNIIIVNSMTQVNLGFKQQQIKFNLICQHNQIEPIPEVGWRGLKKQMSRLVKSVVQLSLSCMLMPLCHPQHTPCLVGQRDSCKPSSFFLNTGFTNGTECKI